MIGISPALKIYTWKLQDLKKSLKMFVVAPADKLKTPQFIILDSEYLVNVCSASQ
jgi:hypothetical protein